MRPISVQVRGLLGRDELERYNDLFEVGKYLEAQGRFDLARKLQREIDLLAQPAIDKLMTYQNRPQQATVIAEPVIIDNRPKLDSDR